MTTVEANGVTLGIEQFGDAAAPLVLCAGGTTMLSWPDELCEADAIAALQPSDASALGEFALRQPVLTQAVEPDPNDE